MKTIPQHHKVTTIYPDGRQITRERIEDTANKLGMTADDIAALRALAHRLRARAAFRASVFDKVILAVVPTVVLSVIAGGLWVARVLLMAMRDLPPVLPP